jgi:hypothetical protein
VGTRRVVVGTVLGSHPRRHTERYYVHQVAAVLDLGLGQPNYVHVVLGVFPREQDVLVVEQVVQLPTVNLVEGDPHFQIASVFKLLEDVLRS